ncbi:MAG TPA: hypothetical protein DDY31_01400, partial [Lachnospiraceae bacterium]|nr:hypothetical protein [Lachnospiraceae bacterium]
MAGQQKREQYRKQILWRVIMQKGAYNVSLKDLIEHFELENCTPEIEVEKILITQTDVNRPALQLAGYFDYFDSSRIQMIGHVEHTYMQQKGLDYSVAMMERIMAGSEDTPKPPCIIFCREIWIEDKFIELAIKYNVPLLRTDKETSSFMAVLIRWLNA